MRHDAEMEIPVRLPGSRRSSTAWVLIHVMSLAGLLLSISQGCANSDAGQSAIRKSNPLSISERLVGAPNWVIEGCRAHWTDEQARARRICGVGSAPPNRNPIAARETAIARARSEIARDLEVTIESLVRVEDRQRADGDSDGKREGEMREIIHQLASASLPACQLESVWQATSGEIHALVSLKMASLQQSLQQAQELAPAEREDLARRAAAAFAEMNSRYAQDESRLDAIRNP